jgi:hypothetical protein
MMYCWQRCAQSNSVAALTRKRSLDNRRRTVQRIGQNHTSLLIQKQSLAHFLTPPSTEATRSICPFS